ncbi:MAG: NUDIX hydrolase [Planctomycetota bacterium]
MPYTPILATLGYVLSRDGQKVLLVHRNKRPNDPHFGKFNGLGGKLERFEDPVSCMTREIHEESGILVTRLELRATINWPGFGKAGEDWFGFLFRVTAFDGVPHDGNSEGTLGWHDLESVASLPMWEGDRYFLPLVLDPCGVPFHATMPYKDGKPVSWHPVFLPPMGQARGLSIASPSPPQ